MARPTPPQPCVLQLEPGSYRWCACGESAEFPLCGAREGCAGVRFTVRPRGKPETQWLCGCGATKTAPYCDGSHNKLGKEPPSGWSILARFRKD